MAKAPQTDLPAPEANAQPAPLPPRPTTGGSYLLSDGKWVLDEAPTNSDGPADATVQQPV